MARMYRAGTAFVEVVPSFKGMQKDIARHFRESLRKELSNKDTFKGLEKNLERAFQNGIKNASAETRKQVKLAVEALENDTAKAGRVANKNLREATKNIGGAFEMDIRKAGTNLRKVMGQEFGKGLDSSLHEIRDDVRKGMDRLASAFHDGGLQNVKEIRKTRNRLEKNLKAMLDMPGMTELARANAEEALKALNSAEYLRRLQGMSDQELKLYQSNERRWVNALVTARNEREAQARRDEAAAERAAEAKEKQAEKDRIAEERRKDREKEQADKLAKEEREADEKRRRADIAAADELAQIERDAKESRLAAAKKFGKAQQDELDRIEADVERRRADVRKKTEAAWKEYENRIIGGDFEAQVRKGGKKVRDALSKEFGEELSGELAELRDDVRRDMDLLAGAYRHGGLMNEREINEVRQRLAAALDKLSKDSRAGGLTRFNAESGLKALDSNEYLRTLDSMNEAELRAYREHQNKLLKAQVEANRALTTEERRHNEERHQNQLAEERRQIAADARENARRLHNRDRASRREMITGFDREGTRRSRTDRLAERSEASIRSAQARVTAFLRDLERLDRARPRLVVETHDAVSDIRQAQQAIRRVRAESGEPVDLTIRADTTAIRGEVRRLKGDAERILSDVNLGIDIEDEEFRKAMAEYRAQLELLDQMEVDPELTLNPEKFQKNLREVRANLMRLETTVTSVEVVADTDEAARDVHVLQAALAALKDKTVGVDISEREALAEIATIEAALERLKRENPEIEVDVVYDRSAFNRFQEGIERSRISIGRLNRAVENSRISMSDTTQAFRIFSPVMTAVALAGGPVISTLGGIAGGLGAVVSALPGAVGGLSALGFAFGGLGDAVTKYRKAQDALETAEKDRTQAQLNAIAEWENLRDAVGENTIEFIEYTESLQQGISKIQGATREAMFPGLQRGLENVMSYEKPFTDFMGTMGALIGSISEHWGQLLASDAAGEWFARVARDAELYTSAIAMTIENFVEGFAHLTDAFRPFAREFMAWLVNSSQRFEDWADGLMGSRAFYEFLNSARATLPLVGDLLKNLGELFVNLTIAVEPFTIAILDAVNAGLDFINAMDPGVLAGILGAVGGLTAGLMVLSGVMAGMGAISAVIGALGSTFLTKIAAGLAGFLVINASAIGAMEMSEAAAGYMEDAADNLANALGGMADFGRQAWDVILSMYEAIEPLIPTVVDLASALIDVGTSIGSGFLVVIEGVIDAIGWMIELFAQLPVAAQEVVILFAAATTAGVVYRDEIKKLWDVISGVIGLITTFGGGAKDFVQGFFVRDEITQKIGGLAGGIENVGYQADVAKTKAQNFKGALMGWGAVAVGLAAVTTAVAALAAVQRAAEEDTERLTEKLEAQAEAAKNVGTSTAGALTELLDRKGDIAEFTGLVGEGAASLTEVTDDMAAQLSRISEGARESYEGVNWVARALNADTRENLASLDDALAGMIEGGNLEGAVHAWEDFAEAAEASGVPVRELIESEFPGLVDQLMLIADEVGVVVTEQELMAALAEGRLPDALIAGMEANEQYKGSIEGIKDETGETERATRELIAAQDELAGRFLSQEEANLRYFDVLDQFNEHMKTATKTLDIQTEAGRENRRQFQGMAEATRAKAEADLEATGDVDAFTDTIWAQRDSLIEAAESFGMSESEAEDYANTLLEIPKDIDTEAELHDYASKVAREIQAELDDIERNIKVRIDVTASDAPDWLKPLQNPNYKGSYSPYVNNADGNLLEFMANGGLRPMSPIAQMVPPNTWRVVGDRSDVDEAYIPLDGSKRSLGILMEAMARMPGLFMAQGGIVAFAEGGVAVLGGAAAPEGVEAGAATLAPVAEAFAALEAAMREGYTALMAELLGMSQAFFEELLAAIIAFHAAETEASALWRGASLSATRAHLDGTLSAMQVHLSAMTGASTSYRDSETAATSTYLSNLQSLNATAQGQMTGAWSGTYGTMGDIAGRFRSTQYSEFDSFYGSLTDQIIRFGADADFEWSKIWNGLVNSADEIFGRLPGKVGSRLAEINRKMNENIVSPFNKIVKDMDLDDDLKLSPFPTQAKATGGHVALRTGGFMPGYTPGRDVHTFVSPTGGVLELSGGEPVLRPEAGVVLGRKWVDDVNAAARSGGVNGVRQYLTQGYASGGMTSFPDTPTMSFASGGMIPRTTSGIVKLGKMLQSLGVRVAEHPAFGGVGRHSRGSWHYRAGALDLNTAAGQSAGEQAYFDELAPILHQLGWGVIWRYPGHLGHLHVDIGNRSLGNWNRAGVKRDGSLWDALKGMRVEGGAGGGFGFIDLPDEMKSWIEKSQKETSKLGRLGGFSGGIADQVLSALAEEKADEFYSFDMGSPSGGSGGSGVERWRGTVIKALEFMGQPTSKAMQDITLRRMNQESSGNPRAINLWDINAKRGDPSKGLMQVIGSTFRGWARAPYNKDIWDPLSNIIASMSWALHRYGSLPAAYNRAGGYADGGIIDLFGAGSAPSLAGADLNPEILFRDGGGNLPTGFSLVHNNLAHEETILPHTTAEVTDAFRRIEDMDMARTVDQSVNFPNAHFEADPDMVADSIERKRRVAAIQRPMKF